MEQESPSQSSTTLLTAVSLANALGMQLSSLTEQGGGGGGGGGGGNATSSSSGTQQQQQGQQGQGQGTSNLTAAQMMMVSLMVVW